MKILVAMSGGVDSTVAAYKLIKEGHEVIGVNFAFADTLGASPRMGELCEPTSVGATHCEPTSVGAMHCEPELEVIAKKLGIKIIYRDFRKEFREKIITSFVRDYEKGITPNPCALCNGIMKFEKLLQVMKEENCDMVATGHYANVTTIGADDIVGASTDIVGANTDIIRVNTDIVRASYASPRYCVKKSKNLQKDQSYMLYRLSQEQLSHIVFPIGDMDKNEVRRVAKDLGLSVADKKDSQDVCFISDISYQEFIKRFEFGDDYREKIARGELKEEEILSKPFFKKGEFVDTNGNVLGFHSGIINYTIGQRRGINIAFGERKFVVKIDVEKNQVVLGDNDDLLSSDFEIYDTVFSGMSEEDLSNAKSLAAKLRYRHDGTEATFVGENLGSSRMGELCEPHILKFHLTYPVRAITPGQSAVFYNDNNLIMFGGRII